MLFQRPYRPTARRFGNDSRIRRASAAAIVPQVYGAAISNQSGEQHINEQWQSFWVTKFTRRDYLVYDVLRPTIWGAPNVPLWYKQNTIFYVNSGSPAHDHFARRFPTPSSSRFDVVHPEPYWRTIHTKRGLRRLAKNSARLLSPLLGRKLRQPPKLLAGDEHLLVPQRDRP
jgi:hypothetical protein